MKFTINYDILEEIHQSKNGYRIKRYLVGDYVEMLLA